MSGEVLARRRRGDQCARGQACDVEKVTVRQDAAALRAPMSSVRRFRRGAWPGQRIAPLSTAGAARRVLVIEDNDDARDMLTTLRESDRPHRGGLRGRPERAR